MVVRVKKGNGPTAAEIGRIGGRNSRKNLSAEVKKELARRAAVARWEKYRKEKEKRGTAEGLKAKK